MHVSTLKVSLSESNTVLPYVICNDFAVTSKRSYWQILEFLSRSKLSLLSKHCRCVFQFSFVALALDAIWCQCLYRFLHHFKKPATKYGQKPTLCKYGREFVKVKFWIVTQYHEIRLKDIWIFSWRFLKVIVNMNFVYYKS